MKKLLLILLIFVSVKSYSQFTDTTMWVSAAGSPYKSLAVWEKPAYPEADTLKCHFLEVVNDSSFQWRSGYVVRHYGYIDFGRTLVQQNYLPVTSGVVTSPVFYTDMSPIKNYAIQIAIKPVGK